VCWDGTSVVGDDVGILVEGFLVGTEIERIAGLFVVGRRVGRGKTGLDVVSVDVGGNTGWMVGFLLGLDVSVGCSVGSLLGFSEG
jgi:hypothetical protein